MSSIKKFIKIGALSLASVAVIGAGGFFLLNRHNPKVNATLAGWNAGNIMSDYVMSNKNAMNESQIQSFLKSKNPCNNTDISEAAKYPSVSYHIENGHFVCMADETFNGESAAHVIWQAAQDYSINPEVLIVLLQKEQGLVTDTWPNSNQYRSATGFGCPDTSVCQSQYYGFKNQIRQAANLFHSVLTGGWSNYPIGIHYIQYSPNAACGGSNVNIQNRATSALYRYTPYQPNAAALASGYGGGATCGAYGNRNFYNYFTDWFGSTRSAVVVPQNQAVWRLWNPTLQAHFMTASANEADIYLASGWQSDGIKAHTVKTGGQNVYRLYNPYTSDHYYTTSTAQVNEYVRAGWLNDGVVFKAATNGNPVWQLWNGKTHFITDSLSEVHTYVAGGWAIDGVKFYEATTALNSVWQLQRGTDAVLTTNVGELMQYMRFGYQVVATFSYDPSGQNVYRLYNPYTSDHYYTTSTAQVNEYVRAGWLNDGVVFKAATNGNPVWQLWNGKTHFITDSLSEVHTYVAGGWAIDGVKFYTKNLTAAHRFYDKATEAHSIAASDKTYWEFVGDGWQDDGVIFTAQTNGEIPVFELHNDSTNSYFYTASTSEKNTYVKAGWTNDGTVFYAPSSGAPIYRLYNPTYQTHILISSQSELARYVSAGWENDGVIFNAVAN